MNFIEHARKLRAIIEKAATSLADEDALEAVELFPAWDNAKTYEVGNRVRYDGVLYSCVTDHTAQADWTPVASPSLWAKVLVSDDGTILPWEQPDSTNPYKAGDVVTHNDKTWESTVDNNVWEPGVYGWTEKVD